MPLSSIQAYCNSLAATTVLPPMMTGELWAYVTPPSVEKLAGPRVYTWGGKLAESRQTAPRGQGFKKLQWTVDLWPTYMDTPGDALANEPFPLFIDAVMAVFRATVMPVFIDPSGNVLVEADADASCSQVQSVGEVMTLDYPPERSTMQNRMLWYQAHVGVSVLEVIQS